MDASQDPDAITRRIAAERLDEPTAWFEDLYRAAGAGAVLVPWDRPAANPLLVEWMEREGPPTSARTIVVGAGYGRDAEYLAALGYPTTAFDVLFFFGLVLVGDPAVKRW